MHLCGTMASRGGGGGGAGGDLWCVVMAAGRLPPVVASEPRLSYAFNTTLKVQ